MQWWTPQSGLQLGLLALAFVLCALIGLERQFRKKSAGFRTHVLVGTGSASFTLVSAFGFGGLLGDEVVLDPSRIAAQIVSGIGFLGAGVIFTQRNVVRGLTTAATIWVAAAVGMAAGAGMVALAVGLTALHLFALTVVGPLVGMLPTRDSHRVLRIVYEDVGDVLPQLLTEATVIGFSALILGTTRLREENLVELHARFRGKPPLEVLIPKLHAVAGVREVSVRHADWDDEEESAA